MQANTVNKTVNTNPTVTNNGAKKWYNNSKKLHRTDGPALIEANGTQMWYKHGMLHNDNGPAVIYPNGAKFWYKNDYKHRTDGPAVIWQDGTQEWCINGKLHNDNGPAMILHTDDPTVCYVRYYKHDVMFTPNELPVKDGVTFILF